MIISRRAFAVILSLLCVISIIGPVAYRAVTSTNAHAATASLTIQVAQLTVNGQTVPVLTTTAGLTLYYDTNDTTAMTVSCVAGCATAWPPLLDTNAILPAPSATGTSALTAFAGGNGTQIEYNGHPLYTYAKDIAAGQVNGQGVGGIWFVAALTIPIQK
jgi:predicted lipoprotein with Yx(FWY)xxD motif